MLCKRLQVALIQSRRIIQQQPIIVTSLDECI